MSKSKEKEETVLLDVEETLGKWEKNVEENKKSYSIIVIAIIAVVGGYLAWSKLYVAPQESEAQAQMFYAEKYFAKDSIDKAMFGDGNYYGFNDIIEEYGVTSSANLAHYYMGISYLKKGEYETAIEYLQGFNSSDQVLGPIAIGAIGDAYVELGDQEEAVSYYIKAAKKNDNQFTTPIYLMRAGASYEELGKYKEAVAIYEKIKKDYSETTEGLEVEKYIARAKVLAENTTL